MNIHFPAQSLAEVISKIETALSGRSLGDMVSFNEKPSAIEVVISKLGTSTLTFDAKKNKDGFDLNLAQEKIAFAHRAFKDEVKSKLVSVIEKAGGKVV